MKPSIPNEEKDIHVQQSKAPLYISLGIVLLTVLAYLFIPSVKSFLDETWRVFTSGNEKQMQEWIAPFGVWGVLMVVVIMVLQMFLIIIPSPLLMVMTVLAYGPIQGGAILLVAIFAASSVSYFVGKYFSSFITKLLGYKTEKKVKGFIEEYGFWTVVVVKLCPFLSSDAVGFVAGLVRMGYWKFIGASVLGSLPLIGIIAYLGDDYERMKSGLIWGSIISIILLAAFVWWDKKKK
ncbi:MAG TPA: VTT domain-containing protein [Flavobacteriaceae bacterium]|nr:VTT domain-containing protein [Flavobacteriaceae bacterium]